MQLREAVFAGDVEFAGGARAHSQEGGNPGVVRRADVAPGRPVRVELPKAVIEQHHDAPSRRHSR